MAQKLTIQIEVTIEDAVREDYKGIAASIPGLLCSHYEDIDVTVKDAITADSESEYALAQQ